MSASQSYLSESNYGYDFVVATTQASINATMDEFINGANLPEVTMCYIVDENGNPQIIDYNTLVANAKGTDPFSVPNGETVTSQDVQNLSDAYFLYAFRAQIGLPQGYAPLTPGGPSLPDVVTLGGNTASVTYNLMCSEFTVVEANYGPRGITSWLNQSQPSGAAWLFTSQVDLRLAGTSDYSTLPPAVQEAIKNIGGNAFGVQQLLFDLDNAALESVPVISGVTAGTPLYNCLQSAFLGAYFTTLQTNGQPVLSYSVTQTTPPPTTLTLTDLNMEVNPFVGANGQAVTNPTQQQQDLTTLCYLCAANGNTLPPATPFTWNWIEESDASSFNGVIAINRNTFAKYIESQLYSYVSENCMATSTRVWLSGFLDAKCNWEGSFAAGQTPTVNYPATGPMVLEFTYSSSSSDEAGLDGDMGQMSLDSSFDVTVTCSGNTIVVSQHLVLYLRIQSLQSATSGNIFDQTITDTYTLAIGQSGELTSVKTSVPVDNSQKLSANWFINLFTSLNDLVKNFENWGAGFVGSNFESIPLTFVQNFYFPGGNTFAFDDVVFSDNQDLVSHITYVQPS